MYLKIKCYKNIEMEDTIKEKTKHETFINELVSLSISNHYCSAVLEWEFDYCEDSKDIEDDSYDDIQQYFCLCGTKIRYLNHIKNKLKYGMTTVGSCCVKKFMKENKDLELVMENKDKIKSKNKKYKSQKKLVKICEKCYKTFDLKTIDEHKWKHRCLKCFIKFKEFEKNEQKMSNIDFDF